jgi:hypothetical protein
MNFQVKIVDTIKDGSEYGDYSDATNTIRIARQIKEEGKLLDLKFDTMFNTFLHELIHVFQYYYNNEYNEAQAQVYANFLMEFLQTRTYAETVNNPIDN